MKNSLELKMNKYDLLVAALIALLALALGFFFWRAPQESARLVAVVEIDGEEADRFSVEEKPFDERTYTANGITLTVTPVERGEGERVGVCVASSTCPSQDCVHTGAITRAGQSIICLPAHVVITLEGAQDEYDLVTG